ncbi:hypothetical protein GF337_02550, partial [candidate division KSB1 bacterium]|nr:hypothetical protein [candidate division KSB1 bacterium]
MSGGKRMASKKRVLIIGLDGINLEIIEPLIRDKKVPVLEKLLSRSAFSTISSVLPVNAAAAWTSLLTGKNSGKHNIYEFYDKTNGSYHRNIISSSGVTSKRVWDILGDHDLKSIVMNIPVTYPPSPVNGIMVSGMLTKPDSNFTYPENLTEELRSKKYIIDLFGHYRNTLTDYMELAFQTIIYRQQAFLDLIKKNEWDFAALAFTTIDRLQQTIWQQKSQIEKLFIKLDELIGEILTETDDGNTYVMLLSNYGYRDVTKKFFVNEWLSDLGLLSKNISTGKASIPNLIEDYFDFRKQKPRLIPHFLAKTGITKDNIRSVLPEFVCEMLKKRMPARIRKIFPKENLVINWDKTKAYFPSEYVHGIRINLKGREPNGIVEPGWKYDHLCETIISELNRLKDPHTFENIVERVHRREEIFTGQNCENAPDIIFVLRDTRYS